MQVLLQLGLKDRSASNEELSDIKGAAQVNECHVTSAEESDEIGITNADLLVSIVVSFSTSVAASVAAERAHALIRDLKARRKIVVDATAMPMQEASAHDPART
jgi:hypothetical protein